MSFWKYIGAGAGAVGGFMLGGPAGAMALGSAGYSLGNMADNANSSDSSGSPLGGGGGLINGILGQNQYQPGKYIADEGPYGSALQDLSGNQQGLATQQQSLAATQQNAANSIAPTIEQTGTQYGDALRNLSTHAIQDASSWGQTQANMGGDARNNIQTAGQGTMATANNFAGQQQGLAQGLLAAPSVVEAQGQAAMAQQDQANAARLAGARGPNAALMLRDAAQTGQAQQRDLASNLAAARAQEQVSRYGAAGGILNQAAGTALTGAQSNQLATTQGEGIRVGQENAGAGTAIGGYGTAGNLLATAAGTTVGADTTGANLRMGGLAQSGESLAQSGATLGQAGQTLTGAGTLHNQAQGISADSYNNMVNAATGVSNQNASEKGQTTRAILGGAAQVGGAYLASQAQSGDKGSSEKFKMAIRTLSDSESREALDSINPVEFRYKPAAQTLLGETGEPQTGVIAEDLERTPAGKAVVKDTPKGKMLDGKNAISFSLAQLAALNRRIDKLEGSRSAA